MHHSSLSPHPSSFQMCPVDRPVTHARGYALAQIGLAAGVIVLIFIALLFIRRAARWIFGAHS